jgi:hypothetical protein
MFKSCRYFLFFQLCVLIVLLTGCDNHRTPNNEMILAHLENGLAPYYKVVKLEYKNFANLQQEGVGRTSIAGMVELTEDLFIASNNLIGEDLEKSGMTLKQWGLFYPKNRVVSVHRVSEKKGKRIQFNDELSYIQTSNGFAFSGVPRITVAGKRISELPRNAVMHGSPEYTAIINDITTKWQTFTKRQDEVKREIENLFAGSQPLVYTELNKRKSEFEDRFDLNVNSPIVWSLTPTRAAPMGGPNALNLFFEARGEITWIMDGSLENAKYKAQDVTPVLISGGIYGTQNVNDRWSRRMSIYPADPGRRDGFASTSSRQLTWAGSEFQWVWANGEVNARLHKQ